VLRLSLARPDGDPPRLLVIGAHADDIEIGCGATILRLVAEHPGLSVDWLVLSGHGERAGEAADSATAFLTDAGATRVIVESSGTASSPTSGEPSRSGSSSSRPRSPPTWC
jgi:LmbE family N-acetylglucosaminyl deacetylase